MRSVFSLSLLLCLLTPAAVIQASFADELSQPSEIPPTPEPLERVCPEPALSRLITHTIVAGETIESIARQYNLIPATLMGMNPVLRGGNAPVGTQITIPPYNGIQVEVPAGQTWQDLANVYQVRPDALFEVNGCQENPRSIFVPGVNWSPARPAVQTLTDLSGYPLPDVAVMLTKYGWQLNPLNSEVTFNSGVDLQADVGTPVMSAGDGIVAFAGDRGSYGNVVVINHRGGRQTRYAHLNTMTVTTGQAVKQGENLGTVGVTGTPSVNQPHLHFEVRYNSPLGWVAEDPALYIQALKSDDRF